MPSNHLILCRPLLLLPSIFPSIRVFSNESALRIRWPKYWSFSFNISPSNEHPGLISYRMDWLDLLAVQGTLKSLLQHHTCIYTYILCLRFVTSAWWNYRVLRVSKYPFMTFLHCQNIFMGYVILMIRKNKVTFILGKGLLKNRIYFLE